MLVKVLKLSMLCCLLYGSPVFAKYNLWEMPTVGEFQNDEWSCGVHSANRLLKAVEQNESYAEMREVLGGEYKFDINISYRIRTKVLEEVCDSWKKVLFGSVCLAKKTVEKIFEETKDLTLPIKTNSGLPDKILVKKLQTYYRSSFRVADRRTFSDLTQLIDVGKMPMALIHNWSKTRQFESKAELAGIGILFGPEASVIAGQGIDIPNFHWIIINGYDDDLVYYFDTYYDEQQVMTKADFMKQWEWKNGPISGSIDSALNIYEDMHPNTLLWIDEALPISKNLPFRGVMVAINSLILQ